MSTENDQYGSGWVETAKRFKTLVDTNTQLPASPGKGVFLGHAFSVLLENPEGIIAPDNPSRRKLEKLMEILRLDDFSVHCALEREGWGERLMSPEKAVVLDNDQVSKADHIVTYPQNSPGAFMELGFAAAGADINMTNKSLLIILSGSVTQTDAINLTDEQNSVRGVIEWMKTQGSRAEVIYDNTVSLEEFVATVVPQIQDFVNPAQGEH